MPDDLDAYLDPVPKSRGPRTRDPLDLIAHYESGNRNIHQNVVPAGGGYNPSVGRVTGPSSAQGPWQITNSTWRKRAPRAGVDVQQYPNAMSAPIDVQRAVAAQMFKETGYKDWAPYNAALRAAIRRGEADEQAQQKPKSDLDSYLDPVPSPTGQTPPVQTNETSRTPIVPPVSPKQSKSQSVPSYSFSGRAFGPPLNEQQREVLRQSIATYEAPRQKRRQRQVSSIADLRRMDDARQSRAPEVIDAGNSVEVDLATGQPKAPSRTQRIVDALGKPSSSYDPRNALRYLLTDNSTPEERQAEAERQQRVAQTSTGEYLSQIPKSAALGLSSAAESGLKSIAVLAKKLDFGGEYEGKEVKDLATYRAGEWIARNTRQILGSNPDLEKEFIVGKSPQAIGQALSFLLGGVATKAPRVAVAVLGAGMTTADAYDEVRRRGGSDEEAVNAGLLAGAILGPTELIGTRRLMKALSGTGVEQRLNSALVQSLRDGSRDAVENALQEIGQEYAQGKITGVSREGRQLLEAGLLGAIGGAGVTAPVSAIAGRGRAARPAETVIPEPEAAAQSRAREEPATVAPARLRQVDAELAQIRQQMRDTPADAPATDLDQRYWDLIAEREQLSGLQPQEPNPFAIHPQREPAGADLERYLDESRVKVQPQVEAQRQNVLEREKAALAGFSVSIGEGHKGGYGGSYKEGRASVGDQMTGAVKDFVEFHEQAHHIFKSRGHEPYNQAAMISRMYERPDVMVEFAETSTGQSHFTRASKADNLFDDNPLTPNNYDWVEALPDLWAEYKLGRLDTKPRLKQWLEDLVPDAKQEAKQNVETQREEVEPVAGGVGNERAEKPQGMGQARSATPATGETKGVRQTTEAGRTANESRRTAQELPSDIREPSSDIVRRAAESTYEGATSIKREEVDADSLQGYMSTSRGDRRRVEELKRDLQSPEAYFERLIIDGEGNVVEGAHRLNAIRELGIKRVPVVRISQASDALPDAKSVRDELARRVSLHPEQVRQVVDHAAEIVGEEGVGALREYDPPAGFERQWNVLVEILEKGTAGQALPPQRFYHRDYGEVTESPNQKGVWKGRVRVTDADGNDHIIKRADMAGRGNQRAIPIREVAPGSSVTEPVTESRQPEITAPKNAAMAADRETLGLSELQRSEPESAQRVLDEAKAANQRDPRSTDRLVTQALEGRKNFSNVETMQLNLRAAEIKNRANELQREIYETKDESAIAEKRVELNSLIDEFDRLSQAQRASGREWGRAGIARQRAIDEDYSLVGMVARFKAAAGREPSQAERAQIEQQSKRIAELEAKLSTAEEQLAKKRLQGEIDRISRRQRRTQSKAQIDSEWADLKNQFAEIRQREASFFRSEEGSFDPEAVRLIGRMVRNRVQAGVVNAEQLVDEIHGIVGGDKRELRDTISGYRMAPAQRRSDVQRQIDALKSELRNLSKEEDVAAGRRAPRQEGPAREFQRDQARQRAIERQIADLEAQMASGQFRDKAQREPPRYTRETHALQKELDVVRAEYDRMKYRATASTGQKVIDTALGLGNAPKTLLSMGDLSALLRQGGYGYVTHPVLSTRAAQDMLRSFSERGFANVEAEIKSHPQFEEAKQNGVEFTGIDKLDPRLSKREEGYLGSGFIDAISKGKLNPLRYTVKPLKDVSERTFVSFLDSQRMRIYAQQASAIRSMRGLTDAQVKEALKAQAKLVNMATGRGSLGKRGNEFMPALNIAMFSPRLLASRIQLLNKMFNPVAWANTPKGARKLMMIDNAKFLGFTLFTLGLARAAGAAVNLDPDDSEFLKIKVGNTRYDTLTGLQQPMRFFLRMVGYGGGQVGGAMRGGETYSGDPASDILLDFTRSKTSPEVGYLWDAIEGKNRLTGKKFDAKMDALRLAIPLPAQDFQEAIKTDGVARGFVEAMPSLVGIGSQTYQGAAEKATTRAEKLARRKVMQRLPDEARTQEEIDVDTKKSQLRTRARRGEDVSADIAQLKGKLTERQVKGILAARSKTRLQEDVNRLGIKDALLVYSVANPQQRVEIKKLIDDKAGLVNTLPAEEQPEVRRRLAELGINVPAIRISRPTRESRQSRATR